MKFSDLMKEFYKASEFKTPNALAKASGQTRPFVNRILTNNTKTIKKIDAVFYTLTPDISAAEVLAAIELLKKIKNGTEKDILPKSGGGSD